MDFEEFKKHMIRKDQAWGYSGRESALRAEYEKHLASSMSLEPLEASEQPDNEPKSILTSCRTCDGKVSSTAPTCPHCGETTPGRRDSPPKQTNETNSVHEQSLGRTNKCNTCGRDVSISAKSCPNCGASEPAVSGNEKALRLLLTVGIAAAIWWYISGSELFLDTSNLPINRASYLEAERIVGCASDYSAARKDDIFARSYKDHWMTWSGEVVIADSDSVALNIDGKGTQDLQVDFEDGNAGYSLREGQYVTVKFVMKSVGGCFLPFTGKHARLL